ncbi:MAG: putative ABC transporter permease [Pseudoflavonifractor sp.]
MPILQLLFLFFIYSFLGWVFETLAAGVKYRRYVDRSALFGPLCAIYGITALVITLGFSELTGNLAFLFLASAVAATVVEWIAGHLLEKTTHTRWWDYSKHRWNLDGYISLQMSALWGVLGVVIIKWGNPLLLRLYHLMPVTLAELLVLVLAVIFALDCLASLLTLTGTIHRLRRVEAAGNRLAAASMRIGHWLLARTEHRIQKAHPGAEILPHEKKAKSAIFAQGCGFYKVVWLFFIGAFLGDVIETIFCRITAGFWMSRSSVVWGPFSIVWGLAMAFATLLLYKYRDRPASFLFVAGTVLGGVYEYLCSVFTELVFGTVFWDYSAIPFNIGGRVNLLYCFFWGFAAVAWFRLIYPFFSRWIEKIPKKPGVVLSWCLIFFMVCNVLVSGIALGRYNARSNGEPARNSVETYIDAQYGDERMAKIYPNAKQTG